MPSFIKSPDHIHIVFDDGRSTTIYKSQPSFDAIVGAIRTKRWGVAYELAFPIDGITEQITLACADITNNVNIQHGIVTLNGDEMHGTLVDRMLDMFDDGFDVKPMALFLENLSSNPSYSAVTELYMFLEKSQLPITDDGHFLAYKRVDNNFRDIRTGTFDNSPGAVVRMSRNLVNDDRDQTCSVGLHFCSHSYLPSYANDVDNKTVLVKINPRDVVSIPSDYDNAKGRCCLYVVVSEIKKETTSAMPVVEARIENKKILMVTPGAVHQIKPDKKFPNLRLVLATHESIKAAATATGIKAAAIKRVCSGDRKTTGGFGWAWVVHDDSKTADPDEKYHMELEDDIVDEEERPNQIGIWRIR